MRKRCKVCGELKSVDDFYRAAEMKDGYRNDCKGCNLAAKAARYRANPEPAIERTKRWRDENPERYREYQERWRASGKKKEADRRSYLRRKYGISVEQYDELFETQEGRCAICGSEPTPGISLHVDHDHETGERRGLLCFKCNNALGDFNDDTGQLIRAVAYLESHDPDVQFLAQLTRQRLAALSN